MALFAPYRQLGYISAAVPFSVQRRGRATFLTVSAGKAFQIYNCAKLTLIFVGQPVRRGARSRARSRVSSQLARARSGG
jgi:U3 small nucleolar RNA-associated protein 21